MQGMAADAAKAKFCRVYSEAHTPARSKQNFSSVNKDSPFYAQATGMSVQPPVAERAAPAA